MLSKEISFFGDAGYNLKILFFKFSYASEKHPFIKSHLKVCNFNPFVLTGDFLIGLLKLMSVQKLSFSSIDSSFILPNFFKGDELIKDNLEGEH